jgi:hypothetical protein
MIKKTFLILVLMSIIAEGVFAQMSFGTMPKNTITVDFGPTLVASAFGASAKVEGMPGGERLAFSGFGIAAQYERQLLQQLSVAGRFAYLGFGIGITQETDEFKGRAQTNLSSFSIEGHVRFYPTGGVFFLDGMLGYANLLVGLTGDFIVTDDYGIKRPEQLSLITSRDYLKFGGKLGWRINIGRRGGFTIEPSCGYYGEIGLGDTIGKKLTKGIEGNTTEFDESFAMLEQYFFIGGPRISLALGWRF